MQYNGGKGPLNLVRKIVGKDGTQGPFKRGAPHSLRQVQSHHGRFAPMSQLRLQHKGRRDPNEANGTQYENACLFQSIVPGIAQDQGRQSRRGPVQGHQESHHVGRPKDSGHDLAIDKGIQKGPRKSKQGVHAPQVQDAHIVSQQVPDSRGLGQCTVVVDIEAVDIGTVVRTRRSASIIAHRGHGDRGQNGQDGVRSKDNLPRHSEDFGQERGETIQGGFECQEDKGKPSGQETGGSGGRGGRLWIRIS